MSNEPRQQPRRVPDDAVLSSERHPSAHRDGRLERRRRNRHAVLDAYLELTRRGNPDPTMEQLAEIAGVSHRSVFRYFDDRAALLRAVADHVMEQLETTLFVEHRLDLDLDERIDRFVAARVAAHTRLGRTAARVFARCDDAVPGSVEHIRARLRGDLHGHFRSEIDDQDHHDVAELLELAVAPFHFETMQLLARTLDENSESLAHLLRTHLHLLLAAR